MELMNDTSIFEILALALGVIALVEWKVRPTLVPVQHKDITGK